MEHFHGSEIKVPWVHHVKIMNGCKVFNATFNPIKNLS